MNTKNIFNLFLGLLLFLTGCKQNQDITQFNIEERMIYFGFTKNADNQPPYDTLMTYSFALDNPDLKSKRIAIPMRLMGTTPTEDLAYTVEVVDSLTTLNKSDITIEEPIFHKGLYVDTLYVNVKKTPEMASESLIMGLKIKENQNFKLGLGINTKIQVSITDYLAKPNWWDRFQNYFGPYHKEVYQQWIQIYALGVDPTPNVITGKPYLYWNNMPSDASFLANTYPIMYYHIQQLKKYFQDNVVYPNGDTTKPRITLP